MLAATRLRRTLVLSPEQTKMFDILERNQRRIAELIDSVLIVERNAHALRPKRVKVALSKVIDETVAAAKVTAEAKGLHLEAHFDPEVVVQVDPKLTASAIENVVLDAVKYTDEGDIHVDVEVGPNKVTVHVRDACAGLSRESRSPVTDVAVTSG